MNNIDNKTIITDDTSIDVLGLSVRTYKELMRGGYCTVGSIKNLTLEEALKIDYISKRCYAEIMDKLEEHGVKTHNVYMVSANTYFTNDADDYGACFKTFGIYSSKEKAEYAVKRVKSDLFKSENAKDVFDTEDEIPVDITEIPLDDYNDIILGGV